jgi:hypothetical protein
MELLKENLPLLDFMATPCAWKRLPEKASTKQVPLPYLDDEYVNLPQMKVTPNPLFLRLCNKSSASYPAKTKRRSKTLG